MSERFTYVRYDERAASKQEAFKAAFEHIEELTRQLPEGRAKNLILTNLEVAYMWTGKSIRDDQIARSSQPEHVSERG